jgi:hypothetical protein
MSSIPTLEFAFLVKLLKDRTFPHSSELIILFIHLVPSGLLDRGLQRRRVSANDLADLLAALEDDEGGHGADAELLRDVWDFVNVELDEVYVGVLV